MKGICITDEQMEFIRMHYPTNSSYWIAKRIGLASSVVRHKAQQMGVKHTDDWISRNIGKRLTNEDKHFIEEHYHNHSSVWIAKQIGCADTTVRNYAHKQGLEHSDEFWNNLNQANGRHFQTRRSIEKRTATIRERIKRDKRRIRIGLDPYLNRNYGEDSYREKEWNARWKLIHCNGYIGKRGCKVFHYNAGTKRSETIEKRYARFGFTFLSVI